MRKQFTNFRKIAYVMKLHCTNIAYTFVAIGVCDSHTIFNFLPDSKYKPVNDMGTSTLWNVSNWVTFHTESFSKYDKMQNMTTYGLFEKRTQENHSGGE